MKPTKEQEKKFWEHFGFIYSDDWSSKIPYKNPQGDIVNDLPVDLSDILKCVSMHWLFAFVWCLLLASVLVLTLTSSSTLWAGYQSSGYFTRTLFWLGVFLLLAGVSLLLHYWLDFIVGWF